MTSSPSRSSVTLSIRKDLADQLDQVSEERMVGKAMLVEKALDAFLPTLPPLQAAMPSDDLEQG